MNKVWEEVGGGSDGVFGHMTPGQAVSWLRERAEYRALLQMNYLDDPVEDAVVRYAASAEWRATTRLLPRGRGRALDLGAGCGLSSYALSCLGWEVWAVEPDVSDEVGTGALNRLRARTGQPHAIVTAYGESLGFKDNSFDLVFCRQVLHHIHRLDALFAEMKRVLRPDGRLVATREHVIDHNSELPAFLREHIFHQLTGSEHAYTLQTYTEAMAASGLRVCQVLGPWESVVNYYPSSDEDRQRRCAAQLFTIVGYRAALRLTDIRNPFGRMLTSWLAPMVSRRDHTPGRLFTFVARKVTRV